ncbi:nucleotidyltransferase domain-containing protein [Mediterraneibacter sp. NSJ-55]|uniref:Nucleotidyltransferase domain-containing protein n=1 Tax=Mediterraneibacter hominis TaxID=2763054 RepID=A0A923LHE3_9FIRM|nr:nucleotidyltransferase domain-containing protein [Mediterraneibacter hominis]MBC5688101.1 nucleotidyltransferase domain-containing protein [Mediterraneibacter hominis]
MNIKQIYETVAKSDYDFLREDRHLGNNIILLGLGGSHAYGTNTESSDLDIRGCALNSKRELLTNENFEQFVNEATDTTIYSFNKLISLLINVNPNTIELLGLRPDHYLSVSGIGKELLDNAHMFLSKKAVCSFGGYANQQLRRLDNKVVRLVNQEQREQHILNSINNAYYTFPERYSSFPEDSIKLYIDKSNQEEYDTEIFMDVNLHHYPLRDYKSMWSEMNNIVKDYSKIGKRNKNAIEKNKLGKHMMHLVRLYYMCFDILEKEQIITYREKEHDLLMGIRNGKYLDSNRQPIPEFFEMVGKLEKRLEYDKENTSLPDKPDYNKINEFVMSVNERVVKEET